MKKKQKKTIDEQIEQVVSRPEPEPVLVEESTDDTFESLARPARPAWKPDTSACKNAVTSGELAVDEGDNILIEYAALWRDTAYYKINRVNRETGDLYLYNPHKLQFAMHNFKRAAEVGDKILVPSDARKWIPGTPEGKAGRRRRKLKAPKAEKPVTLGPDGQPIKRKRGRPKGSKNKSTLIREAAVRQAALAKEAAKIKKKNRA